MEILVFQCYVLGCVSDTFRLKPASMNFISMDVKGPYKSQKDHKVFFITFLKLILPAKVFIFIREHEHLSLLFWSSIGCAVTVCVPKLSLSFSIIFPFLIEGQIYFDGKSHEHKAIFKLQWNVKIGEFMILPGSLQNPLL